MMHLGKREWTLLVAVAATVAGFGGWLQREIDGAATARSERLLLDATDPHASCAGMTVRDSAMMDKGMLWCGSVDAKHAVAAHGDAFSKG